MNLPLEKPREFERQAVWPKQGEWTHADYQRLPDDGWRYEIILGTLHMSPAPKPSHQKIVGRLFLHLSEWLEANSLGELYFAPIDVEFPASEARRASTVQPDLVLVCSGRDIIQESAVRGVPDLIIEVLSPSNWLIDRRDKYELYEAVGVEEYWIVDPEGATVDVFSLRDRSYVLHDRKRENEVLSSKLLSGFELDLRKVF